MDNTKPEETKVEAKETGLRKFITIGGFIGLIIVLAWLGIQAVAFMPNAITSLASLADSVYNYRTPEIAVVANRSETANGETVELSWAVPKQSGTFGISYNCMEGVSIDVRANQTITTLPCGDIYPLGPVSGVALRVFSERVSFAEIPVTVYFFRADSDVVIAETTRVLAVTNSNIDTDNLADLPNQPNIPNPAPANPTTPAEPTEPTTPPALEPPTTQTVVQYTYSIPVSNPSGFTDLEASYITIGTANNNRFIPLGSLQQTISPSAIQFAVKNIGSKTSGTWTYLLQLPNGTVYTSPAQEPLKPNERAVITQGFTTPAIGNYTITGSVIMSDSNISNNSFTAPFAVR